MQVGENWLFLRKYIIRQQTAIADAQSPANVLRYNLNALNQSVTVTK